jgi:hypothetical protein
LQEQQRQKVLKNLCKFPRKLKIPKPNYLRHEKQPVDSPKIEAHEGVWLSRQEHNVFKLLNQAASKIQLRWRRWQKQKLLRLEALKLEAGDEVVFVESPNKQTQTNLSQSKSKLSLDAGSSVQEQNQTEKIINHTITDEIDVSIISKALRMVSGDEQLNLSVTKSFLDSTTEVIFDKPF